MQKWQLCKILYVDKIHGLSLSIYTSSRIALWVKYLYSQIYLAMNASNTSFFLNYKFHHERETGYRNIVLGVFFALGGTPSLQWAFAAFSGRLLYVRHVCLESGTKQKQYSPLRRDVNIKVRLLWWMPCSMLVHTTYSSSQWAQLLSKVKLWNGV